MNVEMKKFSEQYKKNILKNTTFFLMNSKDLPINIQVKLQTQTLLLLTNKGKLRSNQP